MGEINISPMIDMVFILLIFFIVTTVFVEEPGITIDKPPAVTAEDQPKNSILIAIDSQNNIVYGGDNLDLSEVRPLVQRLLQQDSAMPVILQVDENAAAGTAVKVVDQARLAGGRVILSTEIEIARGG